MSRSAAGKGDPVGDRDINQALIFFNMGERGRRETCFVYGVIRWHLGSMVKVTLARGRRASDELEFLRSDISFQWESNEAALIRIPVSFVKIFGIAAFVLDDESVERHQRYVEHFNSPKLSPPPTRQLETVGGVRI